MFAQPRNQAPHLLLQSIAQGMPRRLHAAFSAASRRPGPGPAPPPLACPADEVCKTELFTGPETNGSIFASALARQQLIAAAAHGSLVPCPIAGDLMLRSWALQCGWRQCRG